MNRKDKDRERKRVKAAERGKKQRQRDKLGPRDIPKHACVKQECRTSRSPAGPRQEKVTKFYWCATCHRDMGSSTQTVKRLW